MPAALRLEAGPGGHNRRRPSSRSSRSGQNPFSGGRLVVDGKRPTAVRPCKSTRSYVSLDRPQDWSGYDYLKADLDTEALDPTELYVEMHDTETRDYWTRVNYSDGRAAGPKHAGAAVEAAVRGRKIPPGAAADPQQHYPPGARHQ